MGRFLNPDNSAFEVALNSEIYVDKTGLLTYTNKVLNTKQALICNSRPRRFGKSITADMITAYYSRGCNSKKMFENLEIAQSDTFQKHLNQYDVIHLDIQWCLEPAGSVENVVPFIIKSTLKELREIYSNEVPEEVNSLADALSRIKMITGKKFIIVIDEWDVLIRDEATNQKVQDEYIKFLRGLFKGSEPTKFIQLAFLTGILPIKKLKTQSALNNFDEFTMLNASILAPYIGFTEQEVKGLCQKYNLDFDEVKRWYDGYLLAGNEIYNPKSIVSILTRKEFQSYWSQTGTYESIVPLINMDFDGLKTTIIKMLAGESVRVKTTTYQNDMVNFKNKDDILTLLIHLGYLAYDSKIRNAFIPNEEIRSELIDAVEEEQWSDKLSDNDKRIYHALIDFSKEGTNELKNIPKIVC